MEGLGLDGDICGRGVWSLDGVGERVVPQAGTQTLGDTLIWTCHTMRGDFCLEVILDRL